MIEVDKKYLKKLSDLCESIKKDKNSLKLFAFIYRPDISKETGEEKWDLVISAKWTNAKDKREANRYVFSKIIPIFKRPEVLKEYYNSLFLVKQSDKFIDEFTKAIGKINSLEEIEGRDIDALEFRLQKAYIFISNPKEKKKVVKKAAKKKVAKSTK